MGNQKDFVFKFLYTALMFMFGMGIWAYVTSTPSMIAPETLNARLMKMLARAGVEQGKFVSQSVRDVKQENEAWKQYDKVFYVSKSGKQDNIDAFLTELDRFSSKNKLGITRESKENKIEAKIGIDKKTYFYLVMIPTEAKPAETAKTVKPEKKLPEKITQNPLEPPVPPKPAQPEPQKVVEAPKQAPASVPAPIEENKRYYPNKKKAALVIEDAGDDENIDPFLELGIPITFGVLPKQQYSKSISGKLLQKGVPFLVDIPMEPTNYPDIDPGKNPLLLKMSSDQIKQNFAANLEGMAGAIGVTNHMGSSFTENQDKMKLVMKLVGDRKLMYFDSMSTLDSKAGKMAKEMKVPFIENELHLDLNDDPVFIRAQFDIFLKSASENKESVAVGHMNRRYLLPILKEYIPKFEAEKISFVYLTDL